MYHIKKQRITKTKGKQNNLESRNRPTGDLDAEFLKGIGIFEGVDNVVWGTRVNRNLGLAATWHRVRFFFSCSKKHMRNFKKRRCLI